MAFLTRSSSCMVTVLIQVIPFSLLKSTGPFSQQPPGFLGHPCASVRAARRSGLTCLRFGSLVSRASRGLLCRRRGQRDGNVLVNGLTLVVIFRMSLAVRTCDGLSRFIRLESQVALLVLVSMCFVAEAAVAKHQVVMRLQVFGIDG